MKESLVYVLLLVGTLLTLGCDTSRVDSNNLTAEGMNHYKAGKIVKALDSFKKAVEINPENHNAYYRMGVIYNGRTGDYRGAIEAFEKATEIQPENGTYWYYLGYSQQNLANEFNEQHNVEEAIVYYNEAKRSLTKAVEVDEHYAEAYYRLGRIHEELGEISEAIDAYSNSIHSDPTLRSSDKAQTAVAYLQLGLLYAEYSFLDEAQQVFLNGIDNNPDDLKLHAALGGVYQEMERYTQALDYYFQAITIHGKDDTRVEGVLNAKYGMGFCYSALGDEALDASNSMEAKKNFELAKQWLDEFVKEAAGSKYEPQRLAAQGRASELGEIIDGLNRGEMPQYILDRERKNRGE